MVINTHGGDTESSKVMLATTSDHVEISNELSGLIDDAAKRGVRIAIQVGSCYSGNLIKALGPKLKGHPNVCLLAASSPGRLTYVESEHLIEALDDEPNLEAAYLSGREKAWIIPFIPMVSSPAGLMAARDLDFSKNHVFDEIDSDKARADRLCTDSLSHLEKLKALANSAQGESEKKVVRVLKKNQYRSRLGHQ